MGGSLERAKELPFYRNRCRVTNRYPAGVEPHQEAFGGQDTFPPPDPMQDWFMRLSLDFQRLAENESISAIDHLACNDQVSMLPILRLKSTNRDQLFTVV
jgi:hypothetical protein